MKNFDLETYDELHDIKPSNKRRIVLINNKSNENTWEYLVKYKITAIIIKNSNNYEINTLDGSVFFEKDLAHFLELVDTDTWFASNITPKESELLSKEEEWILQNYNRSFKDPYYFGTFAIRKKEGFITSIRGKQSKNIEYAQVFDCDEKSILVNKKATLNAPFLWNILNKNPHINYIIHGHDIIGTPLDEEYCFPGTKREFNLVREEKENFLWLQKYHGFIAGFEHYQDCVNFIKVQKNKEIDWSNYYQTFPKKYTQSNDFDTYLKSQIMPNMSILDIGGGSHSHVWENHNVSLLDPFVDKAPYYKEKISYEDERKYDLIVFRGSINYLSSMEMKAIQKFMKKGTKVIFNTFENPPKNPFERAFESSNGMKGKEISKYDNGLINHQLIGDITTHHYFYYHSKNTFEKYLGLKLKVVQKKGNSLILEGIYEF